MDNDSSARASVTHFEVLVSRLTTKYIYNSKTASNNVQKQIGNTEENDGEATTCKTEQQLTTHTRAS